MSTILFSLTDLVLTARPKILGSGTYADGTPVLPAGENTFGYRQLVNLCKALYHSEEDPYDPGERAGFAEGVDRGSTIVYLPEQVDSIVHLPTRSAIGNFMSAHGAASNDNESIQASRNPRQVGKIIHCFCMRTIDPSLTLLRGTSSSRVRLSCQRRTFQLWSLRKW